MAGRRDFDTDEAPYLQDVGKYCETVLLHRADEGDNGEFFPDIIRQFADLGLLELMFDEQRNLQLHRMRLVHRTTECGRRLSRCGGRAGRPPTTSLFTQAVRRIRHRRPVP